MSYCSSGKPFHNAGAISTSRAIATTLAKPMTVHACLWIKPFAGNAAIVECCVITRANSNAMSFSGFSPN